MSEPSVTPADIDRLALASEQLALATVEYQERAKLARHRYRATIALIVVCFGLVVWRQQDANDAARNARHAILDCVVSEGQCFKDGQARTAAAVAALIARIDHGTASTNRVTTLAAACAPDYVNLPLAQRIVAIEHCVQRGLR